MVNPREITISLGRTINTGDYSSIRVDYSETHIVGPMTEDEFEDFRSNVVIQVTTELEHLVALTKPVTRR